MELLNFEKPARYLGMEWNVIRKNWDKEEVKICLIYPEVYELGESNLGLKILYDRLNEVDGILCERSYMPSEDMISYLKEKGKSIFSLENKKDLKDFDIIGFSLQTELIITNVIEILSISDIPIFSYERKKEPFIIGGGNITLNPLPYQKFFDFLFVGEAEENLIEFIKRFKEIKDAPRKSILIEASKIDGFYVPGINKTVKKVNVDINKSLYPKNYIVPIVGTVHDRLNVEIMRGCNRKCGFCQARSYYFPYRIRKKENILKMIYSLLEKTGYNEVSLSGLNVTEHPEIDSIIGDLVKEFKEKHISLSLPSLRPDIHSLEIVRNLMKLKRINLTFAPESPYKDIRKIFGKDFDEEEFLRRIKEFKKLGVRRVKLYFILGMPVSDFNEVEELYKMIKNWKKVTGLDYNINCSFFVPKAHSSFEKNRFKDIEFLEEEEKFLRSKLKDKVNFHSLRNSFLEAVFSRGDEKLSGVILRAHKLGCKFDKWKERDNWNLWVKSFEDEGINPFEYAYREYEGEVPWNFVEIC